MRCTCGNHSSYIHRHGLNICFDEYNYPLQARLIEVIGNLKLPEKLIY